MKLQLLILALAASLLSGCATNETFVTESNFDYRPTSIGETYWVEQEAYLLDERSGKRRLIVGSAGHLPKRSGASPLMLWGTISKRSYVLTTTYTEGKETTHATTKLKAKNCLGITFAETSKDYELPPKNPEGQP